MLPYGSKRTLSECTTTRHKPGGKIHIKQTIKSRKYGRKCKELADHGDNTQ